MQGTVAQVVSLVTYGNQYLSNGGDSLVSDFYPSNSTFKFCKMVSFIDLVQDKKKCVPIPYSNDPITWFSHLAKEKYKTLRISYFKSGRTDVPDRMLAGFVGGGGKWLIEAIGPQGSDFWEANWIVGNKDDPDKKVWLVAYRRVAASESTRSFSALDPAALKATLKRNLGAILGFCRKNKIEAFPKFFETALLSLDSDSPLDGVGYPGIVPKHALSLDARQLLGAAQAAWVFGGMGSWNDLGFTGEEKTIYDGLSEELYLLIINAILYATNTSNNRAPQSAVKSPWKFW